MSDDVTAPPPPDAPPSLGARLQERTIDLALKLVWLTVIMLPVVLLLGGWVVVQPYVVPWVEDEYINWVAPVNLFMGFW